VLEPIDENDWDWSWVPNPKEPPYIYAWGNQWNPPEFKASLKYCVPGATEVKYMSERTTRLPQPERFKQIKPVEDFDYSWEPNPLDPAYNYVFGNQWNAGPAEPTLEYSVDGAAETKYIDMPKATLAGDPNKFTKHHVCDFDCSWEPWRLDPGAPPFIYVFGNQWHAAEVMPTVEYHVPGATERKYMDAPIAMLHQHHDSHWHMLIDCECDHSWVPDPGDPPYIYVFGNQWHAAEVMPTVEYHVPGATERKYMNVPIAKLLPNMNLWHVPDNIDIRDMDFSWRPDPGSPPYVYEFATQHQKTGGPQYHVLGGTEIKYVDMMRAEVTAEAVPVVEIDHLDGAAGQIANTIKRIRYFDNYRDTLIRLAKSLVGQHEHVWVCSSICDYSNFDFSWHPERWQQTMLHVFASDNQKFGDTFYMHVPTFAERAEKKQLLEWYSVNFLKTSVPRRPMPVIQHNYDSHVDAVKNLEFVGPLAIFTNGPLQSSTPVVSLWKEKTKTIVPLSSGASSVIVPRVAIPYIKTQLYDYPYIDKTNRLGVDDPCDVVFISNGETMAEDNWKNLLELCPRAKRSDRVDGREAAYKTAAKLSSTPWFFAVFAKTEVLPTFKFDFQPDRLQEPKHYIFYSRNPLNGLEYGAMNINLYNRQLTLDTVPGLDFTLSAEHAVVPIVASISRFNTDPWVTWRSAFREVLKLKREVDLGAGVEIEYRLRLWCERAVGENAEHCLAGAKDALEYYAQTNGDYEALRLSFDWAWLKEYYSNKYNACPWLEVV
jgi:hypothetical protein